MTLNSNIFKLTLRELLLFGFVLNAFLIAAQNKKNIVLLNATAHIGNGSVIPQSILVISQQTIAYIGAVQGNTYVITDADSIINAKGMHLYPGLINTNNVLGLHDAEAVRATRDFSDVGEINPHLRALIAYNTDNLIVPTIKTNGILYTQVTPRGGLISGASSIMALEGFNWEDAVLLADDGIHLN
ncbi:MAG: amidohydrolase, partial [Bacteroidota bacterium]